MRTDTSSYSREHLEMSRTACPAVARGEEPRVASGWTPRPSNDVRRVLKKKTPQVLTIYKIFS